MTAIEETFGRYLKRKRLEKRISLDEISQETCIGVDILMHIEEEDHKRLPAKVYVRGFLKSYALAIGINSEHVIKLYMSHFHAAKELEKVEEARLKSNAKYWSRLLIFISIFFIIIIFSIVINSLVSDKKKTDEKVVIIEEKQTYSKPPSKNENLKKAVKKKMLLKVTAVEDTKLKIIVDNNDRKEYNMDAGDSLALEAALGFNVLLSNAVGVKITLNDKPVLISGGKGQTVNLQLP